MVGSYSPKLASMCGLMLEAVMGLSGSMSDTEKKTFKPQLEVNAEPAVMAASRRTPSSGQEGSSYYQYKALR